MKAQPQLCEGSAPSDLDATSRELTAMSLPLPGKAPCDFRPGGGGSGGLWVRDGTVSLCLSLTRPATRRTTAVRYIRDTLCQ